MYNVQGWIKQIEGEIMVMVSEDRVRQVAEGDTSSNVKDPWKHRSAKMKCHTCMWFVIKAVRDVVQMEGTSIGRCRRHAPAMNGYPVVYQHDWCGDHKVDENRV